VGVFVRNDVQNYVQISGLSNANFYCVVFMAVKWLETSDLSRAKKYSRNQNKKAACIVRAAA
jgi:hypothetical protein